jgi:hypothetical protein
VRANHLLVKARLPHRQRRGIEWMWSEGGALGRKGAAIAGILGPTISFRCSRSWKGGCGGRSGRRRAPCSTTSTHRADGSQARQPEPERSSSGSARDRRTEVCPSCSSRPAAEHGRVGPTRDRARRRSRTFTRLATWRPLLGAQFPGRTRRPGEAIAGVRAQPIDAALASDDGPRAVNMEAPTFEFTLNGSLVSVADGRPEHDAARVLCARAVSREPRSRVPKANAARARSSS